jgi:hypothetical protein
MATQALFSGEPGGLGVPPNKTKESQTRSCRFVQRGINPVFRSRPGGSRRSQSPSVKAGLEPASAGVQGRRSSLASLTEGRREARFPP